MLTLAAVAVALAAWSPDAAVAQQAGGGSPQAEIERYRQMLQDGNPADLIAARGEALWKEARGPKRASLEQCDLGQGPGKVEGAYARLPRYFADTDSVMDFESRLVHCMVTLQGFERAAVMKAPFSGEGQRPTDIESLVAYVTDASRGTPIAVPQAHPKEKAAYARGQQIFNFRGGPYDFSCASCHSQDDQRIRLQDLPNLTRKEPAQRAFASWPAYRVSQGAVRTMQWRLYDCFRQQRFPEMKYTSPASVDLITFLGVNANGGRMDAPAIKR
jgi:sulfur-oxidizing protein SoxA